MRFTSSLPRFVLTPGGDETPGVFAFRECLNFKGWPNFALVTIADMMDWFRDVSISGAKSGFTLAGQASTMLMVVSDNE
jgi:hypothetical protein